MNGNLKKVLKNQRGITLVALVITIVILIILATITINYAFGDDGLIKKAQYAKDISANSTKHEEESMSNLVEYMNEMLIEPVLEIDVAHARENGTKFEDTTAIRDDLGNVIYVPGGFKIAQDSGTKVEEGIVIEDATESATKGNQFVWIPVGIYNVSKSINSTGILINDLTRRQWSNIENAVQEPETIEENGVATGAWSVTNYYGEENENSCTINGNINSINAFKASATQKSTENEKGHGGFYIGRFEQSEDNESKMNKIPYSNLLRDTAKNEAEEMYSGNEFVTSELMSSYAWDTALNFICQTNVGDGKGYVLATTTSVNRANIKTNNQSKTGEYTVDGKVVDKYSNIYDFLGNMSEWTTEYSPTLINEGIDGDVYRGGAAIPPRKAFAAVRNNNFASGTDESIGFRTQLYIK